MEEKVEDSKRAATEKKVGEEAEKNRSACTRASPACTRTSPACTRASPAGTPGCAHRDGAEGRRCCVSGETAARSAHGRQGRVWDGSNCGADGVSGPAIEATCRGVSWEGDNAADTKQEAGPVDAADPMCRPLEEEHEDELWEKIERVRDKLTRHLNPARLTQYLRQCRVINEQDEQEVLNTNHHVTRMSQAGRLIDILRTRGMQGYNCFLESLELYYPQLYTLVTGQKPKERYSILLEEGPEAFNQFLLTDHRKMQDQCKQHRQLEKRMKEQLRAQQQEKAQLEQQVDALQGVEQRNATLMEEREHDKLEQEKLRDESYKLALRHAHLLEEKHMAERRSRDLQLQVDQLNNRVRCLEEKCCLARTRSIKLEQDLAEKNRAAERETVTGLQAENERLKVSLREVQKSLQAGASQVPEPGNILMEILEQDLKEAQEQQQEQSMKVLELQSELDHSEQLREKYFQDMEDLQQRQNSTQKDCEFYQQRMNTVLAQLAEIEKERDQARQSRDQVQKQHDQSLAEKDEYRKRVRDLEEERDLTRSRLSHLEAVNSRLSGQLKPLYAVHTSWGPSQLDLLSPSRSSSKPMICSSTGDFSFTESSEAQGDKGHTSGTHLSNPQLVIRSKSLDFDESCSSLEEGYSSRSVAMINRLSTMPFPPGRDSLNRRQDDEVHRICVQSFSCDSGIANVENVERPVNIRNTPVFSSSSSSSSHFSTLRISTSSPVKQIFSRQLTMTIPVKHQLQRLQHTEGCVGNSIFIVGGNHTGIFVKSVKSGSAAEKAGLSEGCRLLKVLISGLGFVSLENCTREVAHRYLQSCDDPTALSFQNDKQGYQDIQDLANAGRLALGDSFYVRTNVDLRYAGELNALRVPRHEILHVMDTMCQEHWFCAHVDRINQKDLEKGTVPNYHSAQKILQSQHEQGSSKRWMLRRKPMKQPNNTLIVKESDAKEKPAVTPISNVPDCRADNLKPYILLQPYRAQTCRPVIFFPSLLARGLIRCLLELPASSLDFDFCPSENLLEEELITARGVIVARNIPPNLKECVRVRTIKERIRQNKHCLLELDISSVKELIRNEIYPIIIHIQTKAKSLPKLRNMLQLPGPSTSDMMRKAQQEALDLLNLPYPAASLDSKIFSRTEDLVKAIRILIFQEQPKLLWVEEDKLAATDLEAAVLSNTKGSSDLIGKCFRV